MSGIGRRTVLAGGAVWLAAPMVARAAAGEPLAAILAGSGLGPVTAFALADLGTGQILEGHRQDVGQPPASVAKIVTALYALEALGPDYRFVTRVLGAGPVESGALEGDMVLAGGGDPVLDTDGLGDLATGLHLRGLTKVAGRFLVAGGALPAVAEIDADQPEDAAYNPSISGMNLNFNRAFLAWRPGKSGPVVQFSAPGARFDAKLASLRAEVVADGMPRRRRSEGREVWSLPRVGLRGQGSVWLPVRRPGVYAGEVFGQLAAAAGLSMPAAEEVKAAPGAVLALRQSPALEPMLRDMLKYSTNLTAEVVGLRAGQVRGLAPDGLAGSAAAMTAWTRERFGLTSAVFVNHSGLSDRTRLAPAELVAVLGQAAETGLRGMLRERPILDAKRQPAGTGGVRVVSKTGTMDFISGLAGYMTGRRQLAFAIFAADPGLRARIRPEEREKPPGGSAWTARARAQEQALLRRWAAVYAL